MYCIINIAIKIINIYNFINFNTEDNIDKYNQFIYMKIL